MGCYTSFVAIIIVYLCVNTRSSLQEIPANLTANHPIKKSLNRSIAAGSLQSSSTHPEAPKFADRNDKEKFIPRLPSHYVSFGKVKQNYRGKPTTTWLNRGSPVFETSSESDALVTIYRGRKAELIFNSVMDGRPYKMLEPIPGQVIRPPIVPFYKPGAFRKVGTIEKNRIPFYAHEAIHPWSLKAPTQLTDSYMNEKISDPVNSKNESEKDFKTNQKQAVQIVYAIPYSKFVADYDKWMNNYKECNHSRQECTTVKPVKAVNNPHINRQIQAPSSFNSRISNVRPANFVSLSKKNMLAISPSEVKAPNSNSSTLNPTKHRIVYYAKSAGFKSHTPFLSSTRKKLHMAQHAHYVQTDPILNQLAFKDTRSALKNPNPRSDSIFYRIRKSSDSLVLPKLNRSRNSQQQSSNSAVGNITIMPRWYIRNQRINRGSNTQELVG